MSINSYDIYLMIRYIKQLVSMTSLNQQLQLMEQFHITLRWQRKQLRELLQLLSRALGVDFS
jgi:hypothetical protein